MSSELPDLGSCRSPQLPANEPADQSTDSSAATEVGESNESNIADQTPPPSSEKPKRSWKHILDLYQSGYGMLSLMITLIVLGAFGALGHHLYYQSLHGQRVQESQWPVRFGTALAFFVKASFIGSIEIAYRQQAWLIVKKRNFKISTLDSLFSACFNPWGFADFQFLSEAYLAAVVALFVWLLPLSAIASPSALAARGALLATSGTCDNVPMLDFTRENGFGADSEDQERSGMSYWNLLRDDQLSSYDQPSAELRRIFKLSVLSYTGPPKPSNPCPSVEACTYTMDIAAPTYNCQKRREFGGQNPLGYKKSQLSSTGLLYTAYSSIDETELGWPVEWVNLTSSAQEFGLFTEIPSLWVGWVTKSADGYSSHVVECVLYNATTSFDVTFSGENMSMNQTGVNLISPLLPKGSTKAPKDSDYQQFSGYHAASYLYRSFLFGNLTSDPDYGWIDQTDAAQTNWFEATTGITLSSDFATTIEHGFRDFFIAMVSDTKLHSQITYSVPCTVTENVLVWNYAPFWLVFSYSVAVALNAIAAVIGVYCFQKNGCSMNTTFSTFIVTTRSSDLDELAEGQHMGRWPICKEALNAKVRFGELSVLPDQNSASPRRTAFAFPGSVQPIINPKKYL